MRTARWLAVGAVTLAVLAGCGSGASNTREVTSADLGDSWPLTVEAGTLKCEGSGGVGAVTIEVDGRVYAVNGAAAGVGADIEPIWAPNPDFDGAKINIQPLVSEGLSLCY